MLYRALVRLLVEKALKLRFDTLKSPKLYFLLFRAESLVEILKREG